MNTKYPTLIYLRVATAEQETDSQEHQVFEYCRVRGWHSPRIFRGCHVKSDINSPGA